MHNLDNGRTKTLEDLQFELYDSSIQKTNERLIGIFREVQEFEAAQGENSRALQAGTFPALKADVFNKLARDRQTPSTILDEVFREAQNIKDIKTKETILSRLAANPKTPSAVLGAIADDTNQVQNLAQRQAILTALAANPNTTEEVKQQVQNSSMGQDSKIGANSSSTKSSFLERIMNFIEIRKDSSGIKQPMQNSMTNQPKHQDVSSKNPAPAESSKGTSFVDRLKKSIGMGNNQRTR